MTSPLQISLTIREDDLTDGLDVGNGGFSLRSRRLLEICRSPQFLFSHPEDVAIGRHNRPWLVAQGVRFAPRELADSFSAERASSVKAAFGFHGVWHMPQLIGADRFWEAYCELDWEPEEDTDVSRADSTAASP